MKFEEMNEKDKLTVIEGLMSLKINGKIKSNERHSVLVALRHFEEIYKKS